MSTVTIVNTMAQFRASLMVVNNGTRVVSYAANIVAIQVTGVIVMKLILFVPSGELK